MQAPQPGGWVDARILSPTLPAGHRDGSLCLRMTSPLSPSPHTPCFQKDLPVSNSEILGLSASKLGEPGSRQLGYVSMAPCIRVEVSAYSHRGPSGTASPAGPGPSVRAPQGAASRGLWPPDLAWKGLAALHAGRLGLVRLIKDCACKTRSCFSVSASPRAEAEMGDPQMLSAIPLSESPWGSSFYRPWILLIW